MLQAVHELGKESDTLRDQTTTTEVLLCTVWRLGFPVGKEKFHRTALPLKSQREKTHQMFSLEKRFMGVPSANTCWFLHE